MEGGASAGIGVVEGSLPAPPDSQPNIYHMRRDFHPTAVANALRAARLAKHLEATNPNMD